MWTARRLTAAAILGVVTLVSLAGCVKVDVALSVHDDVVDGTMLIAADKRLADLSGQSAGNSPRVDHTERSQRPRRHQRAV